MSKVVKSTKALRSVRNVTPAKQVKQTKQRATQKFANAPAEAKEITQAKALKPDHLYYYDRQIEIDGKYYKSNRPAINRYLNVQAYSNRALLQKKDIRGFYGLINHRIIFNGFDLDNLEKALGGQHYYAHIKMNDGTERHITMNPSTWEDFRTLMMSDYWNSHIIPNAAYGSDALVDIYLSGVNTITLKQRDLFKRTKIFKNKGGSRFFPYLNKTDIDLTEYQIISNIETQGAHVKKHCLISTLERCGIPYHQLQSIQLMFDEENYFDHRELIKVSNIIEKRIELYQYDTGRENRIKKVEYGSHDEVIRIASIENHFFEYKNTPYTEFSIKNYDIIKNLPNWKNIVKRKGDKYERSANAKRVKSLRMIRLLLDAGKFEKNDRILSQVSEHKIKVLNTVIDVPNEAQKYQRLYEYKAKKYIKMDVFYANIFTTKTEEQHTPISAVVCHNDDIAEFNKQDEPVTCITKMLDFVTRQTKGNPIIYFNNLRYAYNMMKKNIRVINIIQKNDTMIYMVKISHNGRILELHDTSKFTDIKLDASQSRANQVKQFKQETTQFATNIKKITNLSMHNHLSISSIADEYVKNQGAYNGVYECNGIIREYLGLANYGGRVAVLDSIRKKVINSKVQDLDANSLYPSAIVNISNDRGIPMGECKKIITFEKTELDKLDYYVCTIKITKINKKQQIPFIPCRNETDTLQYLNKVPEDGHTLVVDRITLEDFIEYHQIEYQILDGIYWSNGFNKKLGQIMVSLFNDRQACTDPSMANAIKLLSNSVYGKSILKKYKYRHIVMNRDDSFDDYRYNHFHQIKEYQKINDYQVVVTKHKVDNSFTMPIIGVMTYSYSKKIMNEVMSLANDNNIRIYYQDTDSLHLDYSQVRQLEEIYEKETGKTLIGNQLGQFKNDFKMDGAVGPIYSKKSIFLAQKSYIDILESTDKDGKIINSYHYRMKGVGRTAMLYKADEEYGGKMDQFYEDLAQKKMEIILNPIEIDMYQYTPTGVRTRPSGQIKQVLEF